MRESGGVKAGRKSLRRVGQENEGPLVSECETGSVSPHVKVQTGAGQLKGQNSLCRTVRMYSMNERM